MLLEKTIHWYSHASLSSEAMLPGRGVVVVVLLEQAHPAMRVCANCNGALVGNESGAIGNVFRGCLRGGIALSLVFCRTRGTFLAMRAMALPKQTAHLKH